jgi:hypothetical protein
MLTLHTHPLPLPSVQEVLVSGKMDADDDDGGAVGDDSGGEPWVFHLIMFSGALYMAMLLTDWGTVNSAAENAVGGSNVNNITGGAASMWVKVCCCAPLCTIMLPSVPSCSPRTHRPFTHPFHLPPRS